MIFKRPHIKNIKNILTTITIFKRTFSKENWEWNQIINKVCLRNLNNWIRTVYRVPLITSDFKFLWEYLIFFFLLDLGSSLWATPQMEPFSNCSPTYLPLSFLLKALLYGNRVVFGKHNGFVYQFWPLQVFLPLTQVTDHSSIPFLSPMCSR